MSTVLPIIWAGLLAFAVFAYIVLDGFDLGVGILFLVEHDKQDRDVMVTTVAPVWDGNETWLVLGGGGLFAAFPMAYSIILPALYPLMIGMLLALILRGVAFEFRFQATSYGRFWWDIAFCGGSIVATFCQGLILGGLIHGIHVDGHAYAGGPLPWLNGFAMLCGIALVVGYALLGACWLIWRTNGRLQARCRRRAEWFAAIMLGLIGIVSLWTPLLHPEFTRRWFAWPGMALTSPVPLLVAVVAWLFWRALRKDHEVMPLLYAQAWFLLCFVGLGISFYPYIIPPSVTIWQAAAPVGSLDFLLVGAIVMLPIILTYMAYSYWTFVHSKVEPGTQYH
jgi:cytochrome bd ubiquinol oxidase subunit II